MTPLIALRIIRDRPGRYVVGALLVLAGLVAPFTVRRSSSAVRRVQHPRTYPPRGRDRARPVSARPTHKADS
ncbi:hypothetical protein ACFVWY_09095 [Streptomyces sp. NPDC058195]|uniref:hypothetical protein n=1 Tax=Streptomyces sp. NPDC058195 TaxID=3346375 RepID=UPI0036E3E05D